MADQTYGRGQVEWALWRSFGRGRFDAGDAPKVFLTRIKRLLDIDRALDLSAAEAPPARAYAFVAPPDAAGVEAAYSAEDGFCLAVALDLLDSGFKQSEVVFLMRHLRADLERRFPSLLEPPSLIDRQRHLAKHYPDLPSYQDGAGRYADRRLFLVLKKVELTEIIPTAVARRAEGPVILEPIFCAGVEQLAKRLSDLMPDHRRAVTVLELAASAQSVSALLDNAPIIRRGRPKS